jgi:poly(3-hydroxyalkanoate) synthetase
MLLQLHHYDLALQELAKLNIEQNDTIHNMQKELHNIELRDLQIKSDVSDLKLKINGQFQDIHNEKMPSPDLHKKHDVHITTFSPTSIITTTTVTVLTLLRGISSLIPAFN